MKVYRILVEPAHITTSEYYVLAEDFAKATETANDLVAKLNKIYKDEDERFRVKTVSEIIEIWDGEIE